MSKSDIIETSGRESEIIAMQDLTRAITKLSQQLEVLFGSGELEQIGATRGTLRNPTGEIVAQV